ncbi:MAG: ABC transporter permease [Chitinophagales bacterium]
MLKNFIKIAWRNLWKNKVFSLINIIGLSLSVSFCLLLFFYIRQEQSYDAFHAKKDRLFRLEMTDVWATNNPPPKKNFLSYLSGSDEEAHSISFPLVVGTDLQHDFPEIKSITRFKDASHHFGEALIRADKEVYKESHVIYADDNFFSNLSFQMVAGNPKTALASPGNVILSASIAKKYFHDLDPIGRTIEFVNDSNKLFRVAAIAEDAPASSSIRYSMILPIQSDPGYLRNIQERFNQADHVFIVELAQGVEYRQFERKMNRWVRNYFADYVNSYSKFTKATADNFHWYLRPLPDCHYVAGNDWDHYTDLKSIYQLACLVVVILAIASLNYILLAVSNAASRSQEIGIRKVMGANRKSVILQFWVETQIVVAIAVFIGLFMSRAFLPVFNRIIGGELHFENVAWLEIIAALICLSLLLGLLAGYYPALIISKMKPASIIKSFQTFRINPYFSRAIVVLQYTACVIFIIAAFVINKQMRFINNKDLGFDRDQVLLVKNQTYDSKFTGLVKDRLFLYSQSQPAIKGYSAMMGGLNGMVNTNGFVLNGEQKWRKSLAVDYDYFKMLGIQFLQGRGFSKDFPADTSKSVSAAVVNESLFRMLGKEAKLGQFNESIHRTIIGVVKDYHFESLSNKIAPEEHVLAGNFISFFMFKVKAGQMQEIIPKIEKEWKEITGNYPFEYTFLDEAIAKMYEPQMSWQKTIQASCFFAIFIACMGLFGLSAINAANRTKEIGIRKILGASVRDIVGSLFRNFILLIVISIIIATPLAWFLMNRWLEDFAYRIKISWWIFASVAIIALLIALLTVGIQAIKAAIVNPVKSLRNE